MPALHVATEIMMKDKKEQYLASLTRCVDKVNCKDSFKPFNDMKYANMKPFSHISSGSMKV